MQINMSPEPVLAIIAGNPNSFCSETVELYRCRLSHCIWHSRVAPIIGKPIRLGHPFRV